MGRLLLKMEQVISIIELLIRVEGNVQNTNYQNKADNHPNTKIIFLEATSENMYQTLCIYYYKIIWKMFTCIRFQGQMYEFSESYLEMFANIFDIFIKDLIILVK